MCRYILLYVAMILSTHSFAYGQKSSVVSAEYIYVMSKDVTRAEAERIAVDRAKMQAIADQFGTIVLQNNSTIVRNDSGKNTTNFLSIGGTEVKGEWIEDITPPTTDLIMEGGELAIKAVVKGRVREIVRAKIDVVAKILRNGTTAGDESDSFISGNSIYLLFRSPQNGYLTIYLLDEVGDAYCLLPYQRSQSGVFEVEKDREYILFHTDSADSSTRGEVDEYTLTAAKSKETNYLYIIFSPNCFTKASDIGGGELTPRSLTFNQFQEWLTNNRRVDSDMQVISRSIEIKR